MEEKITGTNARIQDFILDETAFEETREAPKKKARTSSPTYSILVENGIDVVVERKTSRTSRILALIPTQNQFYIKENGDHKKLNAEGLKKFLYGSDLRLENTVWLKTLEGNKNYTEVFISFIEKFGSVIKYGLFHFEPFYTESCRRYSLSARKSMEALRAFVCNNPALTACYIKALDRLSAENAPAYNGVNYARKGVVVNTFRQEAGSFPNLRWLECISDIYGIDNARKLIDAFCENNLDISLPSHCFYEVWATVDPELRELLQAAEAESSGRYFETYFSPEYLSKIIGYFKKNNFKHNRNVFEFDRLLEYLLNFPYEGFSSLKDFMLMWKDTLNMQSGVYGSVTEKYPEYLATKHNRLTLKIGELKQIEEINAFEDVYEDAKALEWSDGEWTVIVPKSPQDMVDEAFAQSNCLRSYIEAVAKGYKRVAFLRKAKTPDVSLITIEVSNAGEIVQVKGKFNRSPSLQEMNAVREWARERSLVYNS